MAVARDGDRNGGVWRSIGRRAAGLCAIAGLTLVALGLAAPPAAAEDHVLRIGVQKYGTLVILREQHALEAALQPLGWRVAWTEFPGGPQLLEALNVGALDFGTTGEAPPVFAQAAGAPLVYVGVEPPSPAGVAILVPQDSPVKTIADTFRALKLIPVAVDVKSALWSPPS